MILESELPDGCRSYEVLRMKFNLIIVSANLHNYKIPPNRITSCEMPRPKKGPSFLANLRCATRSTEINRSLTRQFVSAKLQSLSMWKPSLLESSLLRLAGDGRCLSCQLRGAGSVLVPRRLASNEATPKQTSQTTSEPTKRDAQAKASTTQESEGEESGGDFTPLPLDRPIGLEYPPREGQNTGIDTRTLRERRDDFVNYEKHLQRRKELCVYTFTC